MLEAKADALYEAAGVEIKGGKKYVRTAEGARKYKLPIGAVIPPKGKKKPAAKKPAQAPKPKAQKFDSDNTTGFALLKRGAPIRARIAAEAKKARQKEQVARLKPEYRTMYYAQLKKTRDHDAAMRQVLAIVTKQKQMAQKRK